MVKWTFEGSQFCAQASSNTKMQLAFLDNLPLKPYPKLVRTKCLRLPFQYGFFRWEIKKPFVMRL